MQIRLGIHFIVLLFFGLMVIYSIKIFISNVMASRENWQIKQDPKVIVSQLKKLLPWAILAGLIIGALNILPIILF